MPSKPECKPYAAPSTLRPEVANFLASKPLKSYIGGRWTESQSGSTFEVFDPGKGHKIATVSAGGAPDVDAAVMAAQKAFQRSGWATMPVKERAAILHRLADLIVENQEILAQIESLDTGKPRTHATGFDIPHSAQTFRYYADLAVHAHRHHRRFHDST